MLSACGSEETSTNSTSSAPAAPQAQAAPKASPMPLAMSAQLITSPTWTAGKPGIKELMDATGMDFLQASNLLYGIIGSNKDTRDWNAIMNTSTGNISQAARDATAQMYGGYRLVTTFVDGRYMTFIIAGTGVLLTSGATANTAEEAKSLSTQRFGELGFYNRDAQGQPVIANATGSGTTRIDISNDIDLGYQPPRPPPAVTATPPELAAISNQSASQGQAYSLALASLVTATDGDSITSYAITGTLPTGVTLNTSTGVLSGTPSQSGTYNLSATASDKDGASDARSFTLTVAAPPPTASLSKTADALEGNALTFTVTLDAAATGITTANISYSAPSPLPSGTIAATGAASCTGAADYTNGTTSVDIASGQTSATFTVPTCVNATNLQASSVKVTLSSISGNAQLSSTASNVSK